MRVEFRPLSALFSFGKLLPVVLGYGPIIGYGAILGCGALAGCSSPDGVTAATPGISGKFRSQVATYDDGTTRVIHRLHVADGRSLRLSFPAGAPAVAPGSQILVDGVLEGELLEVSSLSVIGAPERTSRPARRLHNDNPALEPHEIAVMNLGNTSLSVDEARGRLLDDFNGPRQFYYQNTYGSWNLTGDAFGPYMVSTDDCSNQYEQIADDGRAAAEAAGVDISKYKQFANNVASSSCGWGGLGEVGVTASRISMLPNYGEPAQDSWYQDGLSCVVFNQELGHNYGMNHSHFCADGPSGSDGGCPDYVEYGDPFTPMAQGCAHFNAVEVGFVTGFAPCNVIDVSDGTYEIGPLEQACFGPQVLRWKDAMSVKRAEYLYVEYRRSIGHDENLSEGIYLHYGPEYADPDTVDWMTHNNGTNAYLVRSTENGLVAGESWTALGGAQVKVVSLGETATIEISGAGTAAPTCLDGTPAPLKPEKCCDVGTCGGGAGGMGGMGGMAGGGGTAGAGGTSGTGGLGGGGGVAGSGGAGAGGTAGTGGAGGMSGAGGSSGVGGAAGVSGSGGMAGNAGTAGAGASAGSPPVPGEEPGGCGCRTTSSPRSSLALLGFAAVTALLRLRRRK